MSVTTVVMNPTQETGYATFMEHPKDGSSIVSVLTKKYISAVLPVGNAYLTTMLKQKPEYRDLPDYTPPADTDPLKCEKLVKDSHALMLKMGYKDRSPHTVEMVDQLYDFDDKKFAQTNNATESIVEIKKQHNLFGGGVFLGPPYPTQTPLPMPPGFQGMKLPPLPLLPPLPSMPV